jgi:hypothetical protein
LYKSAQVDYCITLTRVRVGVHVAIVLIDEGAVSKPVNLPNDELTVFRGGFFAQRCAVSSTSWIIEGTSNVDYCHVGCKLSGLLPIWLPYPSCRLDTDSPIFVEAFYFQISLDEGVSSHKLLRKWWHNLKLYLGAIDI